MPRTGGRRIAILTAPDIKAYVNYTGDDRDGVYGRIAAAVDAAIKKVCDTAIEAADYVHYLDTPVRSDTLALWEYPVNSVSSVRLHVGAFGDTTLFTADDELESGTWYLDTDRTGTSRAARIRYRTEWPYRMARPSAFLTARGEPHRKAVRVAYNAGHVYPPEDLVMAGCLAAQRWFLMFPTGVPLTNESWGGWSGGYLTSALEKGILFQEDIWNTLRKYARGGGFCVA